MTIRPADDDTLPDFLTVSNAVWPEWAETIDEVRHSDRTRADYLKHARWIAYDGNRPVGVAHYQQNAYSYDPRRFELVLGVLPDARGRGIGGALYDTLTAALAPHDPNKLHTWICEADDAGLRFAAQRGYVEQMREQMSRLDVAAFDPTPFAGAIERVEADGIQIRSAAELGESDAVRRQMHAVSEAVHQDVPSADPVNPVPYDEWAKRFESPNYFPAGQIFALDTATGELVGVSGLWKQQASPELQQGITGVARSHRRRGIALALKLRGIQAAKAIGAPGIRTDNATTNEGMLAINRALGFTPLPAWVELGLER
jgi:mycothiol synthase